LIFALQSPDLKLYLAKITIVGNKFSENLKVLLQEKLVGKKI
jgi:hypothetical protein